MNTVGAVGSRCARVAAAVVGLAVVTIGAAGGATIQAPYSSPSHGSYTSCPTNDPAAVCRASATVSAGTGRMVLDALVDSGLGGTLPAEAIASSYTNLGVSAPLGVATAARFTIHVRVDRATVSSSRDARAYDIVRVDASCDRCPTPYEGLAIPDAPGTEAIVVTLVRGTGGGQTATLTIGGASTASITCHDFCVAPGGTGHAAMDATVTGVDEQLLGLGTPSVPRFTSPSPGAVVIPSEFTTACDTGCVQTTGEALSGTADPGMHVRVIDGSSVVGDVEAGEDGAWGLDVSLGAGRHSLVAEALGPQGTSTSPPLVFTVAG